MKWWNRQLPDNLRPCSYFCELITAAALKDGVTETWQSSLEKIFAFLDQHAFEQPIIFGNYDMKSVKRSSDLVIVLDAVNPENNVADKWYLVPPHSVLLAPSLLRMRRERAVPLK